jgi:hypothetical protein
VVLLALSVVSVAQGGIAHCPASSKTLHVFPCDDLDDGEYSNISADLQDQGYSNLKMSDRTHKV